MISLPARAVMKRELLSGLRNPRPFFFLGLFMLIMILGLLFMVEVVFDHRLNGVGTPPASLVSQLFMVFSMGLYVSAVLLVPPMAGVSICVEKQQDSYDLLLMTYIRPFSLALAKLANVLGIYLLITVASLPFLGVFFFLIGIDGRQLAISFCLILCSALSLAAIGLLASAWFYRTLPAIITTYVVGIFLHGGGILCLLIVSEVFPVALLGVFFTHLHEDWVVVLVPFIGIAMASDGFVGSEVILNIALYHGFIVLVGMGLTVLILRRPARPMKVNQEKPIDDQAQLAQRRKRFPYYLLDPRRRRPMIPDGQNPVLAKELHTGILSKGALGVRVTYGFTILSFFVSFGSIASYGYRGHLGEMVAWSLYIDTLLILLVTPTLVATSLAKEWEWHNVDSLRSTLLSTGEIARGKFGAALRTAMLPLCGALLGNFALCFFGYDSLEFWLSAFVGLCGMAICILYTMAISFFASSRCRHSLSALMASYAASIIALVLIPQLLMFLSGAYSGSFWLSWESELVLFFSSPLYAQFSLLSNYSRIPWHISVLYWLLNALCFCTISWALVWWAQWRYHHDLNSRSA